jgi:hypothetical protein
MNSREVEFCLFLLRQASSNPVTESGVELFGVEKSLRAVSPDCFKQSGGCGGSDGMDI